MVNSVSNYNYMPYSAAYRAAAGSVVINKNEIQNMIKFINNEPIVELKDPSIAQTALGTLPFAGIIGGFQGIAAIKNNGLTGAELEAYKAAKKAGTAAKMSLAEKFRETIKNVKKQYPYTRNDSIKAGKAFITREYGDFFKKVTTPNEARLPFGIGKLLDKIPGYKKLRATGFGKAMGRSGAGIMLVMDGTIKTLTDVVPTFQNLGVKAGMKQIAKSGTEVALGAAGWLAGDAVGMSVGAAIGTAIFPGVGTAIGGFLGRFIGGAIGGAVAAKTAKAITGKSEMEKAKEAQLSELTNQVESSEETKIALAQETLAQAQKILAQDPNNAEANIAKASAEKIIGEISQTSAQEETTTINQNPVNNVPSFQGIPVVPGFNGYSYDMNQFYKAMQARNMFNTNPFIK